MKLNQKLGCYYNRIIDYHSGDNDDNDEEGEDKGGGFIVGERDKKEVGRKRSE